LTQPRILIFAGPNGAGKTTFARAFLPREAACRRFINADLIAAGLSPFAADDMAVRAGRLMLEEMEACTRRLESFALETTLSGLSYLRHIPQWRALGYRVSLFFLALPAADLSVARVAERVRQGGHDIPEPVIRRRFDAGRRNFDSRFRAMVDDWACYDNSGVSPALIEWGEAGEPGGTLAGSLGRASNPDLASSRPAIRRAALSAREIARRSGTAIALWRQGGVQRFAGEQLAEVAEVGLSD